MDPKTTLDELRAIMSSISIDHPDTVMLDSADMERLVALWQALDGWMTSGGFSPWVRDPLRL